jgi:hypothetical protein
VANLTDVLRALVPEWNSTPIYPVRESEGVPPSYLRVNSLGYYSPGLHIALAPWLRQRDRWRGPGPAFLIRDAMISKIIQERCPDDDELASQVTKGWTVGALLHEAAHALVRPISDAPVTDDKSVEVFCFVAASNKQAEARGTANPTPDIPGFFVHDWRFMRAALHLHSRYIRQFGRLPLCTVVRSGMYSLSNELAYQNALRQELDDLPHGPVSDVLSSPPPDAFTELFQTDVQRWIRHNKEQVE